MEILGLDIGGTGMKGAPVDVERGELTQERFRIPTPQPSVPSDVVDVATKIVEHFEWDGPIGITFPGVVIDGTTWSAANVDKSWIGLDAGKLFAEAIGRPVTLLNDADAAGIAEMRFGAGVGKNGVVMVLTLGTGIGSAVFADGKLVPNTELGHVIMHGKDAEHRASAQAREIHDLTWEHWAKRVVEYLQYLEALFSPSLFIIGGGISKKPEKFMPYLTGTRAPVVPAALYNNAGIVGAALAAE